jgi:transposase-like protein
MGEGVRMRNAQPKRETGVRRWRRAEEVEEILEEYRKSGDTQRVFAREMGVAVSTLQWWLRRARSGGKEKRCESSKPTQSVSLLEVELADTPPTPVQARMIYEIEWHSEVRLCVPGGFEADDVRRLLALLREA